VGAEPSRHAIRELACSRVQANASGAAEWGFVAGGIGDYADVDVPECGIPSDEIASESCGSSNGTNSESPRQIVAASTGHDEHWLSRSYQFGKEAMDRTVAAENDEETHIIDAREISGSMNDEPSRTQQSEIAIAGTRTENCVRNHGSTVDKLARCGQWRPDRIAAKEKPGFSEPGFSVMNGLFRLLCAA
jgi:hypothetical protein